MTTSLPAACGNGLGSEEAILSADCGKALVSQCSSAEATSAGTTVKSAMSDPQTACGLWRSSIVSDRYARALQKQQSKVNVPLASAGAPYLDQAITAWCTANPGAEDCSCAAFPKIAQAWCAADGTCDGTSGSGICSASQFAQTDSTGIEVVQFNTCAPFPCWLDGCRGDALMTTDLFQAQLESCPTDLCVQESSGNSISINSNAQPLPPGSFVVGSSIMNCSDTSKTRPPLLVMDTFDITFPQNAQMILNTMLSNDGDVGTSWSVTDYGLAPGDPQWLALEPSSGGALTGRTSQIVQIVFDQATVQAVVGKTWTANITIQYFNPFGDGTPLQLQVPISLTVAPATQDVVVTNKTVPVGMMVGTGIMGGLAMIGGMLLIGGIL